MKSFKLWYLNKLIAFCDYVLDWSDIGEDEQEDINFVVSRRNYFIREKAKIGA